METLSSKYINVNGSLLDLSVPCVMGILNITPDSFYAGSRMQTEAEIAVRAQQILDEGAGIIDVGAYSSRPNAENVSPHEEMERLRMGLEILRKTQPGAVISVDTFRADVARMCVEEYGVAIINDIAAGEMDTDMFRTVAELNVPYIMMHMQGTPQNMQKHPHYDNLLKEVFLYFAQKVQQLRDLGMKDIILDPGFGFGKTVEHNYELLAHLEEFRVFELPLLVGVSRKSMIYRLLGNTPQDALNGTTVLDTICLLKGADILRVHDVREAVETVKIVEAMRKNSDIGVKDIIDVLLVAFLLYYTYKLMKASGSINVFTGILIFILIWLVVSQVLEMKLLGSIFDKLVSVGVVALIILFQDEIRRFLLTLGSHQHASALVRFFTGNKKENMQHDEIMPVVMACISMGKQKVGALIVIEHNFPLDDVVRTGEVINADINQRLIENIFFKNSPLHDGAMVISKGRIKAAGCILPVSHNLDIPKELGLRHRAAMGISQESDALAIIVSEETGSISVAYKGQFHLRLNAEELESLLTKEN